VVGLQLLCTNIVVEEDDDLLEMVTDVSTSVTCAVELLESLSSYNKIDCGILQLHEKEDVPVKSFLENCVYSFSPQAQQLGVSLAFETDPSEGTK
jgi:hypothetical protein